MSKRILTYFHNLLSNIKKDLLGKLIFVSPVFFLTYYFELNIYYVIFFSIFVLLIFIFE